LQCQGVVADRSQNKLVGGKLGASSDVLFPNGRPALVCVGLFIADKFLVLRDGPQPGKNPICCLAPTTIFSGTQNGKDS